MSPPKREQTHFDDEIFLVGGIYYYRGTPVGIGRRIESSLEIREGARQKEILLAKKAFLESIERLGSATGRNTIADLGEKYLKDREKEALNPKNLSGASLYESVHIMRDHIIRVLGKIRIEEMDQKQFKKYCEKRSALNLVNHRKVMNHFLKWCVHENFLKYTLVVEIPKSFRKPRRPRAILSDDEITKVVEACEGKVLTYVMLYLFMGMRNMEICKLRWDEVDLENKVIRINPENNRRRKARAIPINRFVLKLLKSGKLENQATDWRKDYVFPSARSNGVKPYMDPKGGIRKAWLVVLKEAGVDRHLTPHDLRATFEKFMHINTEFTDTQREKMAGAKIDVQKDIYVHELAAKDLKGLEESVQVKGIADILKNKSGGNIGGEKLNKRANKSLSKRNRSQKRSSSNA